MSRDAGYRAAAEREPTPLDELLQPGERVEAFREDRRHLAPKTQDEPFNILFVLAYAVAGVMLVGGFWKVGVAIGLLAFFLRGITAAAPQEPTLVRAVGVANTGVLLLLQPGIASERIETQHWSHLYIEASGHVGVREGSEVSSYALGKALWPMYRAIDDHRRRTRVPEERLVRFAGISPSRNLADMLRIDERALVEDARFILTNQRLFYWPPDRRGVIELDGHAIDRVTLSNQGVSVETFARNERPISVHLRSPDPSDAAYLLQELKLAGERDV